MMVTVDDTSIKVLGKTYLLKCAPEKVAAIQKAAQFLEEKMQVVRASTFELSDDRLAVLTALSLVHQLQALEEEQQVFHERLRALQNKIDSTLARLAQMELSPAE